MSDDESVSSSHHHSTPTPNETQSTPKSTKYTPQQSKKRLSISNPIDSLQNKHQRIKSSALKQTLSAFGDDVIKVKSTKEFQDVANSMLETHRNLNMDQTLFQQPFEQISAHQVGSKNSGWKSLMNMSIASNLLKSKNESKQLNPSSSNYYEGDVNALSHLFFIVYKIGCFASIVLTGFYVLQAIQSVS